MGERADDARWLIRKLSLDGDPTVDDATVSALADAIDARGLPAGQLLYEERAVPPAAWAVRSGSVELTSRLAGRRSVLQIVRAGGVVGDVSVLLRSGSLVAARVREPGRFLRIPADDLRVLLARHGDLASLWMLSLARRLDRARIRILELLRPELAQSVARLLLDEQTDGEVAMTQLGLAQMLGAQRTSVTRILGGFRRAGLVELGYARIAILDPEALQRVATEGPPREWR